MNTYHLKDWSVCTDSDYYTPPECLNKYLVGFRVEDGKRVSTSHIMKVNGNRIETRSGNIYILEDINPDYKNWIDEQGMDFDPDNPIKIKSMKDIN